MAEEAILGYLQNHEEISDSGQFATDHGLDHSDVVNVIKSLHGFRYVDAQVPKIILKFLKKSCPNCRLEKVKINVILKNLDMTIIKISVVMNVNSDGLVD